MKKSFIICILLCSCSPKGYWITKDSYRAKKPNYKLTSKKFVRTDLLSTNYMYLSQDSLVSGGKTFKSAIGFTKVGRAFLNSYDVMKIGIENKKKNNINNAREIGYYRVEGIEIEFERLTPADFGQYILWKGKIKGDTIFFRHKNWPNKLKEIKYVKSNLTAN